MRKVKTTPMQKQGVDNIMSGKFKSKGKALIAAGYAPTSVRNVTQSFLSQRGVQLYIKSFEMKAQVRFGMTLDEKIQDVYLDGLDADKPLGKHGETIQDHKMRKDFADTIQEIRGNLKSKTRTNKQVLNFFMVDKESRNNFNKTFENFVRGEVEESD